MIKNSPFCNLLWKQYSRAPSIALCRIPELEYAAKLDVSCRALDHCCGDGIFAGMAWQDRVLSAGCDVNAASVKHATTRGVYRRTDVCDVSKGLPYENASFDLIFNNSALEHIGDVAHALSEVSRVLTPGGTFAFNVLNHRYFQWWPLDKKSELEYRDWQPFYHALNIDEWDALLSKVGLQIESVEGYFDEEASRELALLDYMFSRKYIARRPTKPLWWNINIPGVSVRYWRKRLGSLKWNVDADTGAGYFIKAVRKHA